MLPEQDSDEFAFHGKNVFLHKENPILKISGLVFGYGQANPVLNGINLQLDPQESIGLVGANGSGKTTLFRCITGLEKIIAGKLEYEGVSVVSDKDFRNLRSRTGFVLQNADNQLIFPTVLEDVMFGPLNLGFGKDQAENIAYEWLDRTGMKNYAGRLVAGLSGGEKKMIALTGILAMRPELLLLDEPTNELDHDARERVIQILKVLPCAKIVASHDMELLSDLDCGIRFLENGILKNELV